MDQGLFAHLLQLIAKTGDRLIVVDPATRKPVVLMGLAQYEDLVGAGVKASQHALADEPAVRIANEDIAAWRASEPRDAIAAPVEIPVAVRPSFGATPMMSGFAAEPSVSATVDEDRFYIEPLE